MKKLALIIFALLLTMGFAHAQDVYFSGNHNGTGKIWKNDSLVYNIVDTIPVSLRSMQVTEDGTVFSAGYLADTAQSQGVMWQGESILFAAGDSTQIHKLDRNGDDWTAVGNGINEWGIPMGLVWHNGEVLYTYSDSLSPNQLYALCIDSITGDIYSGGTNDSIELATVWKNDTILWQADLSSCVCDMLYDGTDLYACGYYYLEGLLFATAWQNGSILYSINDLTLISSFQSVAMYEGDLYLAGYVEDTVKVWKNGEMLYYHVSDENAWINDLCVNEYGVYYAGQIDGMGTIWRNGEILYQPDDCEEIVAIAVLPSEPTPYFTLTVEANNDDWGTVIGSGEYALNDTATIEAFPNIGYEFLMWNDSITDNPRDIVVTQDSTFIAYFGQLEYLIQTDVTPEGAGTVTGGGVGHYGDTLTLVATANLGFRFVGWDDGITDNPRDIIVTQDSTFVALFADSQCTIEVVSDHPAWGSVAGGGTYYYGDTIEISATAYLGFEFVSWDDGNADNPRTIIVTESQTYTAHFRIQQCLIKTMVTPEGAGTVSGGGTYDYGTTIHLTAHSNPGYVYAEWDDGILDNPRSVFVEGNATFTAVFVPVQCEIHTACNPENGGTVTGGGTYNYGSTATLTATANSGFMFICWNDGIVTNPRNVTVTGEATYTALFHQNGTPTYTVTVKSNDPTLGTVSGGGEYPEGTTIEISATPEANAIFEGWDDGVTDNPRSIVVTEDMTFVANFVASSTTTYTITVLSQSPLLGSVYGSGTYPANSIVTIGANPNQGFLFAGWQDGNMDNPRQIVVVENATYTASFTQTPVQSYTVTVYYDETQGYVLGAGTYTEGSTATLVAIPNDEYMFVKWSDGTTDNRKEVFVDHDIVLAAFFNGTGIEENDGTNIAVYPNPANDILHIEGLEGQHELKIYNALGLPIKVLSINGDEDIPVGDLAGGVYLIRIDESHSLKFVKR